jgi:hypothetical protein
MFSKRELEGYLLVDHRLGEGITPEEASKAGKDTIPVGRGVMFQSPTINCSHCSKLVVLNPDRSRSRGYCPKCDRYVCDQCEAIRVQTGVCRPFKKVIDEFYEKITKQGEIING